MSGGLLEGGVSISSNDNDHGHHISSNGGSDDGVWERDTGCGGLSGGDNDSGGGWDNCGGGGRDSGGECGDD